MSAESRESTRGDALREVGEAFAAVADALLSRGMSLDEAVHAFESGLVYAAVARHGGNLTQAAAALGVHRNTLRAKLQRNGHRLQRAS